MATRFITKALSTAALGIALSLLLTTTTTASPAWSNTAGALQLNAPRAPSACRKTFMGFQDGERRRPIRTRVSWRDNSCNEDGFTVEEWQRNQSGHWVLTWSVSPAANSTAISLPGDRTGPNFRFRVKAFNASGDSSWSNWGN